ncbi:inorganic diphosphatase [Pedobacter endophyticus]|uniref:inorganic diphosphatase n=1 Tax=Pedobacter endophyticus TaxID=2789740 RepID=A0A7S9PYC1_9SPHI|nr:inorganic diphosphatase [Pedobacter endophyticus]QPH39023.1 inorganic diphosphatase [Pedobacter endophyticus]
MPKEELVTVIVETPKGSQQKFDYSPNTGRFELMKLLPAGMYFPFDFGFIPDTIGEDGDPIDVMVISELKTFTGCVVKCRIIGAISAEQTERDGATMRNDRILAIPETSMEYAKIKTMRELPKGLVNQIESFFIAYNEQAGKTFKPLANITPAMANKRIKEGAEKNRESKTLVEIFLPRVNDKTAESKLNQLKNKLIRQFGGLTAYDRGAAEGKWLANDKVEQDAITVIEVMTNEFDDDYWKLVKADLEKLLNQSQILIRYSKINQLV